MKPTRSAMLQLAIAALACVVAHAADSDKPPVFVIHPYRDGGEWLFDDESRNIKRKPFVRGIPEMIEALTADIADAHKGFKLTFSTEPFEGHGLQLTWQRADNGGNWYRAEQLDKEGWLCPVLYKYFEAAPKHLYARADPRE